MLVALLLSLAAVAPDCGGLAGWNAGRDGRVADAACSAAEYVEAHRLGNALHELRVERDRIEAGATSRDAGAQAASRRRQRQIDVDLEAIRGVATTRGWPLDIPAEITP
jgi:hypothetical protein